MTPQELLRARFGFTEFRPGQLPVIEALLAGRAALAVFPTGGGKSLCYQLPALAPECAFLTGFYRPNLERHTTPVTARERDAALLSRLRDRAPGPTIIYVTLQ